MNITDNLYEELPSGLAMILAGDTKVLMAFADLPDREKHAFVLQAKKVSSKADMKRLVMTMLEASGKFTD